MFEKGYIICIKLLCDKHHDEVIKIGFYVFELKTSTIISKYTFVFGKTSFGVTYN